MADLQYVDLYIAGFPCQPWSLQGQHQGVDDERGDMARYCVRYIKKFLPKCFILENVPGLLEQEKSR
eukprot:3478789-Pyramimonas_sp.AAC.1